MGALRGHVSIGSSTVTGTWSLIPSIEVFSLMCRGPIDFVIIDWEHGGWSPSETEIAIQVAKMNEVDVVIRIASPSKELVQRALDCGPDGLQVSGINSERDFKLMMDSATFPPLGIRGYSPWSFSSLMKDASSWDPLLIPQIESMAAANFFKSLSSEDLNAMDLVFIGRYDLSISLGVPGEISADSVKKVISDLVELSEHYSFKVGTVAVDLMDAENMESLGVSYISVGSDRLFLAQGIAGVVNMPDDT